MCTKGKSNQQGFTRGPCYTENKVLVLLFESHAHIIYSEGGPKHTIKSSPSSHTSSTLVHPRPITLVRSSANLTCFKPGTGMLCICSAYSPEASHSTDSNPTVKHAHQREPHLFAELVSALEALGLTSAATAHTDTLQRLSLVQRHRQQTCRVPSRAHKHRNRTVSNTENETQYSYKRWKNRLR